MRDCFAAALDRLFSSLAFGEMFSFWVLLTGVIAFKKGLWICGVSLVAYVATMAGIVAVRAILERR